MSDPTRAHDSDRPDRQTESGNEPNTSLTGLWSWALYDWGNSAYWTVIQTFIFPPYFTQEVAADVETGSRLWGIMLGIVVLIVAIGVRGRIVSHLGQGSVLNLFSVLWL
ncbi:MAG TPA: hypothetical protein VLE46_15370 [Nitrospira sp.]|nr:hypothetical protein [Nitrospira sp.]